MNKTINDGGPAYPIPVPDDVDCAGRFESGYGGMSLRDYFAAKAMQAVILHPHGRAGKWEAAAADAYAAADAMLKARGEKS